MAGSGQSPTLTFSGVRCVRGGRTLFDGFDLSLNAGAAARVTGPNGVGKSSLLRLAAGLLEQSAGSIQRGGGIALANDALALDTHLPLAAALGYWARLDGKGDDAVRRALVAVGMAHLATVPVRILSTGQRKRATLARVIASGAGIWLLDEPTNGLDDDGQLLLEAAMADHRAAGGIVLAASHQSLGLPGATRLELTA
jgi:heme exporter protein A